MQSAFRSLLFWGSLPVLLPQAIGVRRSAPRFAGAGGPNKGAVGSGPSRRLLAIGDSIIAGVGASDFSTALVGWAAHQLSASLGYQIDWAAHGRIGASSQEVLQDLPRQLDDGAADFIMLSVGVNDITSLSRVSTWTQNLDAILHALRRHSPRAPIAVAGIPPLRSFPLLPQPLRAISGVRAAEFDAVARRVVGNHPLAVYVPVGFDLQPDEFSADGFHPSEKSYQKFGCEVARGLSQLHCASEASSTRDDSAAVDALRGDRCDTITD